MFIKGLTLESQSGNIPKMYPQQNEYINCNTFIQKEIKTTTTDNIINLAIFGKKLDTT